MSSHFPQQERVLRALSTGHVENSADTRAEPVGRGIFGVPLPQSILYANVAISLTNDQGESFIYGYVPIVVAKCGVFLKEKGMLPRLVAKRFMH